ncbi:MAG: ABC transporter ATP-binding protein [Acidobacteria bacterium]|nr:ABC transporter ATP-binding protein [Acidobacteriota bacterium]
MKPDEPKAEAAPLDRELTRRLLCYLAPYRGWAIASVVLLVAHSLLGALGPVLTKMAVDHSLRPTSGPASFPESLLPADRLDSLLAITGVYIAVLVAIYFLRGWQIQLMNRTGQRVMHDLRREIFAHLQRMSVSFFDRNQVGRLVTRATSDVDALSELFTSGVVAVAGDLLTLLFIFAAMLWLSPTLTLAMAAVGPLVYFAAMLFRRRARRDYREVRGAIGRINAFLQERLPAVQLLQLFNQERQSLAELTDLNEQHRQANVSAIHAYAMFFPTVELLATLAVCLLLVLGGRLIENGALTIGVLVAFLQYGSRVFRPIQDLSEKMNIFQSAMAAAERIFALLDTPADEPEEPAGEAAPVKTAQRVEFRNVWFAYHDESWVLQDVSFTVEPKELVAVVGHTGAGKTTLLNLLLRFYEPQRGQILVGGRDIREWPRQQLRGQFGVVLQDPALISGTIAENIRLGDESIEHKRVVEAGMTTKLDEVVRRLPDGYESKVGERGTQLSAGQRQLVGFTRALAHNPTFLLLDEATSAVDPETERHIRRGLQNVVKGHTAIVIAHRLSTIRSADRILVMHKGRIRESGKHRELLDAGGLYAKLYQLQFEEQEQG